jgi:microcystin degradation protein MlrC
VRVGIISLAHESNTFAKTPTTLVDFERLLLLTGPEFGSKFRWKHHEVSAFFNTLSQLGIEPVPIFLASAAPSGTITKTAISKLLDRLFEEVDRAGKLDGYLVAPHGAAVAEDIADVDGHWLTELRRRVGAQVPIIGTLDPHATLTSDMVRACNALIAYRTNPHIDQYQCGAKAAELMNRTLRGTVQPVTVAAYPAIAINIERQSTEAEPCRSLYSYGDKIALQTGVLSTSVILGFPYADVPEMGSALIVVMDKDVQRGQQLVDDWAAELYRRRRDFIGELIDIDHAIDQALSLPGPVCLLDMGDNVGGGGPADATFVVAALHRRKIGNSFVCLNDPEPVETAWSAGPGATITLSMGGKTDQDHGAPLTAEVTVLSLHEGRFSEPRARHGAKSDYDMGRTALVLTDSGITIMLTSRRTFPVSLVQLTSCGLDPASFHLLVAKGVHAPVTGYAEVCHSFIRANSPGATTADMAKFTYRRRRHPLFPFEDLASDSR